MEENKSNHLFDWEMSAERKRSLSVNGKSYILRATDPYGLWTVARREVGKEVEIPGLYTTLLEAEKAARADSLPKAKIVHSSGFKTRKEED